MTWNYALMNPPYNRSLHLKFLEKVIGIADNVVSIQPCEFIARTHLKPTYKNQKEKYKNTIGKHLKDLEIVDNSFDAGIDTSLGIYVLDEEGGFDYEHFNEKYDKKYLTNLNKFNTGTVIKDKIEIYNDQKYFVPLRTDGIYERWWTLQLINYLDIIVDGKIYSGEYKGLTISQARRKNPHENPRNTERTAVGISFDTLNEAINFRDSLKLEAWLFIMLILKTTRANPFDKLPLFIDYTKKLSNDDIFDMCNISEDVRDNIVEEMQPFKCRTSIKGNDIGKLLIKLQDKYLNNSEL